MILSHFFMNAWRWKEDLQYNFRLPDIEFSIQTENIETTEWSDRFEKLCRNRLILGGMRYGRLHSKNKPAYDRIPSMIKYLNQYKETGDDELLIDVANYCMLEFEEGNHPLKHFTGKDESDHVKTID